MPVSRSSVVSSFMLATAYSLIISSNPVLNSRVFRQRVSVTSCAILSMVNNPIKARKVKPSSLEDCGDRLRNGGLVAFPTETVYGLGVHALDPSAVAKVFEAKERPLTDPLIVHVLDASDATRLWKAKQSSPERNVLCALCDTFWPGPLTLVAEAASDVPPILMANTGFVACRSPSHRLARSLLSKATVPIAAPSANKFGHVSPTRAEHVWDDLKNEDVWILEGDDSSVCGVGVESTVAKVENEENRITILRQGAVSAADIEQCLSATTFGQVFSVKVATNTRADNVATPSPGQTIRHYSPNVSSFIVSHSLFGNRELNEKEKCSLSSSVIIDYGQRIVDWKRSALAYRDLTETNHSAEAAQAVFETLRWAEQVKGASRILFPELLMSEATDALSQAVKDRLTRAASGEVVTVL